LATFDNFLTTFLTTFGQLFLATFGNFLATFDNFLTTFLTSFWLLLTTF
jgi:hypothetical protein